MKGPKKKDGKWWAVRNDGPVKTKISNGYVKIELREHVETMWPKQHRWLLNKLEDKPTMNGMVVYGTEEQAILICKALNKLK